MLGELPYQSPVPVLEHWNGQPFPPLAQLVTWALAGLEEGRRSRLLGAWTFEQEGRSVTALAIGT